MELNLNEIKVDVEKTFGDLLLVGEPKARYKYVDEKATDEVEAYSYSVLSTKTWKTIPVKVKELDVSIKYNGQPMAVTFSNLECRLYMDYKKKEVNMSVSADGISVADGEKGNLKLGREVTKKNEV